MVERNEWSVYDNLEMIRKAADRLEEIHVYEINDKIKAENSNSQMSTTALENQILEYEIQLAELQKMIDSLNEANTSIYSVNQKLIEANNQLILENQLARNDKQFSEDQAEKIIEAYNKLPRIVKKFYGVK